MFKLIDRWLEKTLKGMLESKRKKIIDKTITHFQSRHQGYDLGDFSKAVNIEADRVYAIVNKSILRERIQRAKYTFWVTMIVGVMIAGCFILFAGGGVTLLISPIVTALVAWVINIGTIPISYNQRIKGGMDSVVINYIRKLNDNLSLKSMELSVSQIYTLMQAIEENPDIKIKLKLSQEEHKHMQLLFVPRSAEPKIYEFESAPLHVSPVLI